MLIVSRSGLLQYIVSLWSNWSKNTRQSQCLTIKFRFCNSSENLNYQRTAFLYYLLLDKGKVSFVLLIDRLLTRERYDWNQFLEFWYNLNLSLGCTLLWLYLKLQKLFWKKYYTSVYGRFPISISFFGDK